MASSVNAALCAMVAAAFWSLLGNAVARHLLPRVLAIGAAPVMGWSVHSALALPLFFLIGFSPAAIIGVTVLCAAAAGASLLAPAAADDKSVPHIPCYAFGAAALLALAPTAAILPKFSAGGVFLADPIFDHSKIAIVDAMTRQGLPPVNPILAVFNGPSRLVYYYLWHFSAAELALPLRVSGWEADIGLTWFTAFASLTLMMGLAVWFGKRSGAAICVVALAAATSLRATLELIFHDAVNQFVAPSYGFAGWLFQSAWVPQHLMAASCVVVAMVLIVRSAQAPSAALILTLGLVVVSGFESSTYVGGVTFAVAALAATPVLLLMLQPAQRFPVMMALAFAAVLAIGIAAPFIRDQFAIVGARGDASPLAVLHVEVLGEIFPPVLRRVLDWPAYWLVLLPIELPATYIAGVIAFVVLLRSTVGADKLTLAALACLAAAGLVVSWLLVSTLGDNNDLGLRAVLPPAMVLIAVTAAGVMRLPRHAAIVLTALGGFVLSVLGTVQLIRLDIVGAPVADAQAFAQTPALWNAVRRYAPPTARVINNPLFLQDLTPWPANMSWALLANRSSCFAGRELALAFAPLPADRREAINTQFIRVFDGAGTMDDVHDLATKYGCDVAVVVPQDKVWTNDPFASSADYRLAESEAGWRIYVAVPAATQR
jgi:hypothetical protein